MRDIPKEQRETKKATPRKPQDSFSEHQIRPETGSSARRSKFRNSGNVVHVFFREHVSIVVPRPMVRKKKFRPNSGKQNNEFRRKSRDLFQAMSAK